MLRHASVASVITNVCERSFASFRMTDAINAAQMAIYAATKYNCEQHSSHSALSTGSGAR
jgi:hypothetical protein